MQKGKIDRYFLTIVVILAFGGFFIFSSASLGLLAREGARLSVIQFNQVFFGLFLGLIAMLVCAKINLDYLKKYAIYIFVFSVLLTLAVFIPKLGFASHGAQRWLSIGPLSFQPSEFLKIAFVIMFASWCSVVKTKLITIKYGVVPLSILFIVVGIILLMQPDTSTFAVIFFAGMVMFVVAGGLWRHIGLGILIALIGLSALIYTKPYIKDRILTFMNPMEDSLGSGYQIQQSLIAIGSGQISGRGFGKSVQKFEFLPEPIGDSIFAVASEEFGFIGSTIIVLLFVAFGTRGLTIASRSPDIFSGLLVVGIVILIVSQSFVNMASMLGVLPLTGTPLLFISHGGTALFFALAEVGLILNVSKSRKTATRAVAT